MRSVSSPFLALAILLLFALPSHAEDRLEVVRSDAAGLELRWTCERPELAVVPGEETQFRRPEVEGGQHLADPGRPDLPTVVQLVAVPRTGPPRVRVLSVTTRTMPLPDLAPAPEPYVEGIGPTARGAERRRAARFDPVVVPAGWVTLLPESWIRGQRLARVGIHPCRYDGSTRQLEWATELVVRVDYPEAAARARGNPRPDHPDWEAALEGIVPNADLARDWRRPREAKLRGAGDSFDSAPTWIRVPISECGLYRVDYSTFANLGVDPGGIDPRTIRVFAGRNLPLATDLLASPPDAFMTECALKDLGDGDAIFDPSDVLLLYALGPHGWANEYDPTRSRTEFIENRYTDETWYWITWGGSFASPPRRMTTRSVPDSTAEVWYASTPDRVHLEENNVEQFAYRDEDGWMWEDLRNRGNDRLYTIDVKVPESGDGFLTARLYSRDAGNNFVRSVDLKVGGAVTTRWEWFHTQSTARQDITGCFQGVLVPGTNAIRVDAVTDNAAAVDQLYTGWFELEYDRRLVAEHGWLKFFSDPETPELPQPPQGTGCPTPPDGLQYGRRAFRLLSFDARPSDIYLFDVTDQHGVVELVDWTVQNASAPHNIRFSDPTVSGIRWYVAATRAAAKPLPAGKIATLRGLRSHTNGTEYIVLHHADFREGSERLAALRNKAWGRPASMVVDIEDVFQEFAWGMRDPVAIRDFLAYTQEGWANGAPLYVALVGDAVFDTKRYLSGSATDFMPTFIERYREGSVVYQGEENIDFYSTDDFFAYLEPEDYSPLSSPSIDVAIGRFPVGSNEAFDVMLDKVEAYVDYTMPGQWQNRYMLVADDERVPNPDVREPVHTNDTEILGRQRVPPAMDKVKVYLVDYPRNVFSKKPEAQAAFIDEFTRGALMVTYTGHGDQNTMAQEEVFVSQKIPELLNEERTTVFSTFSCTVSRFDLISGSSLTELLLLHEGGGAVGTFASGALVFSNQSAALAQAWVGEMFGTPYLVPTLARAPRPLGLAVLTAKGITGSVTGFRKNNEKYVVLGDPALTVRFGRHLVQFDQETVATQNTEGLLRRITGSVVDSTGAVLDGTNGTTPFRGRAFVHVSENADTTGYDYTEATGIPRHISFKLEGPTAYRGEVPVVDGRFEALFYLGEGVQPGNSARVSVFALEDGSTRDASGAYDSLVIAPTISPSQVNDTEGPRIVVRFEGYDRFVDGDQIFTDKPVVLITLEDPSGINLRPFPQFASLDARIDGRDRVSLTEDFAYQDGFTTGQVRRIFSLSGGEHRLEVKAFDNVGNRSEQTVRFTIVLPEDDFDLVDNNVAVYPNPFRDRADLLFRLSHDADVKVKVFTIAGRRIREMSVAGVRGDNVLTWDGTDERGLPLSNGTYLFKLEAERRDAEGQLQSDEYVGKVVRMR